MFLYIYDENCTIEIRELQSNPTIKSPYIFVQVVHGPLDD